MNFITFYYIIKIKKIPVYNTKMEVPTNKVIDWKLVVGESLFGFGWLIHFSLFIIYFFFNKGFRRIGLLIIFSNFIKCPGPALILFCFMTP